MVEKLMDITISYELIRKKQFLCIGTHGLHLKKLEKYQLSTSLL